MTNALMTQPEIPPPSTDDFQGWEELNLCEFPIALLGDRAPDDCLELTFQDTVWDATANEQIQRQLNISALPKHGLPTAKDEEVLRWMVYLAQRNNQFSDRKVFFTHYELIKLLGWNDGAKSYRRITDAMQRWRSTELDYKNAWRDSETKSWADATVSILADIVVFDAKKRAKARKSGDQLNLPLSYFVWGETFFKSMQSKYRKQLDLAFLQTLQSGSAKRLYCFLDKRFGTGRNSWEFRLNDFAFEKMGMSRNYDTGKVKEKLTPAINELESSDYLTTQPKNERFIKKGPKDWRVRFERATAQQVEVAPDDSVLIGQLKQRGVSDKTAAELVAMFEAKIIESQLKVFDWIIEHQPPKNPAGFLIASIRDGYKPPAGFKTKEQLAQAAASKVKRQAAQVALSAGDKQANRKLANERSHIAKVRERLSANELSSLETAALSSADQEQAEILRNPGFRQLQIDLMIDKAILKQFPMADK